ncbi:hypothetical protein DBR32_09505 [Taibaiella sp. KBW10]|uniref:hypothetical protein n=1 Tax=Taibaiella sp. KBW10 TaxID=2153357 RepID=UPI000F5A8AB5|nr:hypothetical protein [Taibaiella sp. KBW10]RQO30937.1 hypothetical protein DBR32_09505 [Taibaiella sp. KBW10]
MKQGLYFLFGLFGLWFGSPPLSAQQQAIVFDSVTTNGVLRLNYGSISRTEANTLRLKIGFKNKSNRPFHYLNKGVAWNDAPNISPYAQTPEILKPHSSGTYEFQLRLGYSKSRLNHYIDLVFTDDRGHEERYKINVFAAITDD